MQSVKHNWYNCGHGECLLAEEAQIERIYAGLVDCPETRRDALTWARRRFQE